MKPFDKWQIQEVELTFGVKKVKNWDLLNDWLGADEPISTYENDWIEKMRQNIEEKGKFWNEDELKFQFISPYLSIFDFKKNDIYSVFSQRILTAKIKNREGEEDVLRGLVEWFVAKGKQIPMHPVFFIHEYKPALKSTPSDPLGQLMIAMFTAQILNDDQNPLYGIYVIGEFWYFVVLKGQEYAESRAYDMTQPQQIMQVSRILKRTKNYIEDILGVRELIDA